MIALVFHLKHDRDNLSASNVLILKDVIPLATAARIVIFFKIRFRKRRRSNQIERGLAMLLKGFAHHFGGQARLHIFEALNSIFAIFDLRFILIFKGLLGLLLGQLNAHQVIFDLVTLLSHHTNGLGHCQLLRHL